MAPDLEPDPSLARERTVLAWERTGLSFAGTGAAVLRFLPPTVPILLRAALGALLVLLGAAAYFYGYSRFRPGMGRLPRSVLAYLALGTAAAGLAAIGVVLSSEPPGL